MSPGVMIRGSSIGLSWMSIAAASPFVVSSSHRSRLPRRLRILLPVHLLQVRWFKLATRWLRQLEYRLRRSFPPLLRQVEPLRHLQLLLREVLLPRWHPILLAGVQWVPPLLLRRILLVGLLPPWHLLLPIRSGLLLRPLLLAERLLHPPPRIHSVPLPLPLEALLPP